jgi:hypothetical protein
VPISISTTVSGNTITATVTVNPAGGITATIEGLIPARVPPSGTPMNAVPGTTDKFTYTVPGPGTYSITASCGSQSTTATVVVP